MLRRFGSFVVVAVSVFLLAGTAAGQTRAPAREQARARQQAQAQTQVETLKNGPWASGATTVTLEADGTLRIAGQGAMADYSGTDAPWYDSRGSIIGVLIEDGVTSIGAYAFYNCANLKSVTIPGSVTNIGNAAFFACGGLTSVAIPNSVTGIGVGVFARCENLTSIEVAADNLDFLADNGVLFNRDSALIAFPGGKRGAYTVPNGITAIANSAFRGSANLTSITIPADITTIGRSAFANCDGLTSISSLNPVPPSLTPPDGIDKAVACLYVPQDAVDIYRNAPGWKDFSCIRSQAEFAAHTPPLVLAPALESGIKISNEMLEKQVAATVVQQIQIEAATAVVFGAVIPGGGSFFVGKKGMGVLHVVLQVATPIACSYIPIPILPGVISGTVIIVSKYFDMKGGYNHCMAKE